MRRFHSYAFGALLLALTLSPAFRSFTDDSYPFSTYPMFARDRSTVCVSHVQGLDAAGASRSLPPPIIVNEEITQAQQLVQAAVRRGERALLELCEVVAGRVAANEEFSAVARVEIVTSCYEPVTYFIAGPKPLSSERHAGCEVRR
jgi:hypothetical protein